MQRALIIIVAFMFGGVAHAQVTPGTLSSFIPKGYEILDTISGDLNRDSLPDMVIVLRAKTEARHLRKQTIRPMLLLTGIGNGNYQLSARNDHAIERSRYPWEAENPYQGVTIDTGTFSISQLRNNRLIYVDDAPDMDIYTFRYGADGNWHFVDFENRTPEPHTNEKGEEEIWYKHMMELTADELGKFTFQEFVYHP